MSLNPSLLLALGIGGFILCAIIFILGLRMMGEEKAEKSKPKTDEAKPVSPTPVPASIPGPISMPPPPMTTYNDNAHEVLRVLRDNLTGRLIIEIAGRRYERVSDIRDPDIGRGFVTTLRDLQKFMTGTQSPATSLPSLPPVEVAPPPESPLSARLAQVSSPANPPAAAGPKASSATPARPTLSDLPPIQKPSMNPFRQAKILKDMEKSLEAAPKSIPEQIDEILQEKLARTPHRGRGCRVYLGPKGGVVFDLDGKSYEGVDQVPDPEVQMIIRAAVAEWEKKQ